MAAKKPKSRIQGRSAETGKFVDKKFVDDHPKITENERLPLPGYGLAKRKKSK